MERKINFNAFAGSVAGERYFINTRVYGCEEECSYYGRAFLFPLTPRVLIASDVFTADLHNRHI